MKKRQSKDIYTYIDNYIIRQTLVDSEELMNFVSNTIEPPEYEELINDYCRKIGNNRIRKIQDKDGLRVFFSNGDKVKPKYINIDKATTNNINDINGALRAQEKLRSKLNKNIKKLKLKVLDGQISLDGFGEDNNDTGNSEAL